VADSTEKQGRTEYSHIYFEIHYYSNLGYCSLISRPIAENNIRPIKDARILNTLPVAKAVFAGCQKVLGWTASEGKVDNSVATATQQTGAREPLFNKGVKSNIKFYHVNRYVDFNPPLETVLTVNVVYI